MFNRTKKYYYGEGTDHIIQLTEAEANAVNKIRIFEVKETPDGTYIRTNLDEKEMRIYNRAADKLNAYLEDHTVIATEEFLETNDVLRPVKK